MEVRLHKEARAELDAAGEGYESRRPGLGEAFAKEAARAFELIGENPQRWPVWPGVTGEPPVRRFLLSRFPFAVAYLAFQDRVVVLAVSHTRRRPGYWLSRKP